MAKAVHMLVNSLFQKNTLEECSVGELKAFTEKYPYYAGGHFLLAKKMLQEDPPGANEAIERSSLFFDNKLYFSYLLSNKIFELQKTGQGLLSEEPDSPDTDTVTTGAAPTEEETADTEIKEEEPVLPDVAVLTEDRNPEIEKLLQKETLSATVHQDIAFAPYYTVDYFASQGINTRAEDLTGNDRFTSQLKSFTEWLKTLKKISPEEVAELASGGRSDEKISSLAEGSLNEKEIVTEAMAEVWLKQGNREKALEVYHKLSLLNPAKSAYFASLIEKYKV